MKTKSRAPKRDVYQEVTDKILAELDAGTVPWKRPWLSTRFPVNLKSMSPYRGINVMLLGMSAEAQEFDSAHWLTFAQAMDVSGYEYDKSLSSKSRYRYRYPRGSYACLDLGKDDEGKQLRGDLIKIAHRCYEIEDDERSLSAIIDDNGKRHPIDTLTDPRYGVKKGQKGTSIVFWKQFTREAKDMDGHPVFVDGEAVEERSFLMRMYSVFNVDQCELPPHVLETITLKGDDWDPSTDANVVINGYLGDLDGPKVKHGGERACYSPLDDLVSMPVMDRFSKIAPYYGTFFHELAHSTGHPDRLNRLGDDPNVFGSDPYAQEELVAEMASSMMLGQCGLFDDTEAQQSAAYIKGWSERIRDDKRFIVSAATQAQKACDHMTGTAF